MRVGIVTHNVLKGDGQGRVNFELAQYMLSQGIDVELVAHTVDEALLEKGATWRPVKTLPGSNAIDLIKVWDFVRKANRVVERHRADYDAILACGRVLSVPHTVNVAHFVHGTWLRSPYHSSRVRPSYNGVYQRVFSTLNARWESESFARAEVVVALSNMVRDELMEIGVPVGKIEIIVNGVDLQEFCPGDANRAKLGLPTEVPLALFVGDLRSPIKNVDTMLRALVGVESLHLALVGHTQGSPYLKLAEDLGLSDRTHFLGFRRDIPALMRAADVFVLISRRDSCPLVLLEALASGLPVVTTTSVGTSNLVGNGGILTKGPADLSGLQDALRYLIEQPTKRELMGDQARRIAGSFGWGQMGQEYVELIERQVRLSPVECKTGRLTPVDGRINRRVTDREPTLHRKAL